MTAAISSARVTSMRTLSLRRSASPPRSRPRIEVGVDDPAAVGREAIRDRLPDAARRAGDQADRPRQITFHDKPPDARRRACQVCKNRAAGTPSAMRWSNVKLSVTWSRMTIWSSCTAGHRRMRPMPENGRNSG